MDRDSLSVYEMLRRALAAQVDMGMDEIVLRREEPHLQQFAETITPQESARVVPVKDLFAADAPQPMRPQFPNLRDHFTAICECQSCPLGATRNKFVYGAGNPDADLMFIGEAPGAEEDRRGEPFVGRAGQLLDRILAAINFTRDDVYIGNILKCRPPSNRDPQPDEMEACFPHLKQQIALIRPKLICALGRISAQALLATKTPLGRLRGQWHEYEGVPMMATYHPAALLRFPAYKKDTWADMQMLRARYDELMG